MARLPAPKTFVIATARKFGVRFALRQFGGYLLFNGDRQTIFHIF